MNYNRHRLTRLLVVSGLALCLLAVITIVYLATDQRPVGLVGILGLCIGYIIREWDDGNGKPPEGKETKT